MGHDIEFGGFFSEEDLVIRPVFKIGDNAWIVNFLDKVKFQVIIEKVTLITNSDGRQFRYCCTPEFRRRYSYFSDENIFCTYPHVFSTEEEADKALIRNEKEILVRKALQERAKKRR